MIMSVYPITESGLLLSPPFITGILMFKTKKTDFYTGFAFLLWILTGISVFSSLKPLISIVFLPWMLFRLKFVYFIRVFLFPFINFLFVLFASELKGRSLFVYSFVSTIYYLAVFTKFNQNTKNIEIKSKPSDVKFSFNKILLLLFIINIVATLLFLYLIDFFYPFSLILSASLNTLVFPLWKQIASPNNAISVLALTSFLIVDLIFLGLITGIKLNFAVLAYGSGSALIAIYFMFGFYDFNPFLRKKR